MVSSGGEREREGGRKKEEDFFAVDVNIVSGSSRN